MVWTLNFELKFIVFASTIQVSLGCPDKEVTKYCHYVKKLLDNLFTLCKLYICGQSHKQHLQSSSSSSSSPSPPAAFLDAAFRFLPFTLPGLPPPSGLERAKSMCFWLSTRTRNEATSTICLPTLEC